ncbi:MAG: NAD(P)-dependent oxidoreductase [Verrucomicrobiota bacterium]
MSTPLKLGWIGTGVMGVSMCGHLGPGVTIFSRTKTKAQPLLDRGAIWADSPRAVAANSDIVFTMVGYPQDVREVYFGGTPHLNPLPQTTRERRPASPLPTGGEGQGEGVSLLDGARPGTILVDMTSTAPSLSQEIYATAKTKNVNTLDAPVSGGDVGARNATLSIMVGGDKEAFAKVLPLFQQLGKTIIHQGPAGAGQHAKLCNQIVIAGTMIGVCESLIYGKKAGLNLDTMLQSIRGGAAACWTLDNLAPRILKGNFDPGFFADHFVKDMALALEEAKRMNLLLPGLQLVHNLYRRVQALGHGKKGTHALYLALEEMEKTR